MGVSCSSAARPILCRETPVYTGSSMTVVDVSEKHQGPRRRAARGRLRVQPRRRPRADRRAFGFAAAPTRASSGARARTSSATRGRSRRSAPSSTSTSRRSRPPPPRRRRGHRASSSTTCPLRVRRRDRAARRGRHEADADPVPDARAGQAENYRKMIVAMADDPRVIPIKLADRLHNMRTIEHLPKQKQVQTAKETLEVYAPLAHRLGIHALKWELEDLAFETLHPRKYDEIKTLVADRRADREAHVARRRGCSAPSSRRSTSPPRSPRARSTSTRSTRRWPRRAASSTRSTTSPRCA